MRENSNKDERLERARLREERLVHMIAKIDWGVVLIAAIVTGCIVWLGR